MNTSKKLSKRSRSYIARMKYENQYNAYYIRACEADGFSVRRSLVEKLILRRGGKRAAKLIQEEAWRDEMANDMPYIR